MTGFAPAFGRSRKRKIDMPEPEPEPVFAPAFGKKRKNAHHDDFFADAPKYAIHHSSPAGISASGQVPFDQVSMDSHPDAGKPWVDRLNVNDKEAFDSCFVDPANIMQHNPDAFEARNASILPVNINYANIQSAHGTTRVAQDDRINMVRPDGTYIDTEGRGKPKKRHIQENRRRLHELEVVKAEARITAVRWHALSKEAQEHEIAENKKTKELLSKDTQIEEVQQIPEEYTRDAWDLSDLTNALIEVDSDTRSATATLTSTNSGFATSHPPLSSRDSSRWSPSASYVDYIEAQLSPGPAEDNHHNTPVPSQSSHDSRYRQSDHRRRQSDHRHRESGRRDFHQNIDDQSPRYSIGSLGSPGTSLPTPTTFSTTFRPRVTPGSFARLPSQPAVPRPAAQWSKFGVLEHPVYIPFEDITPAAASTAVDDQDATVHRIIDLCRRKPRVVTVRLPDEITSSFTEAICGRLFGGMVQEIQFFPKIHHAIICFVHPTHASAFIKHVHKIRLNSEQEYRRLELAATWWGDADDDAIMEAQEQLLHAVVHEKARRVLLVSGIDKNLSLDDVNGAMKSRLQGHLIVKGRLVVPTKIYERQSSTFSNSLVLEMASIRDAIDVREMINVTGLKDFPGAKAEFTEDPIAAAKVARAFCDCTWCKRQKSAPKT